MRLKIGLLLGAIFLGLNASAVEVSGAYPCINQCTNAGGNPEICAENCVGLVLTSFDSDGDGIPSNPGQHQHKCTGAGWSSGHGKPATGGRTGTQPYGL